MCGLDVVLLDDIYSSTSLLAYLYLVPETRDRMLSPVTASATFSTFWPPPVVFLKMKHQVERHAMDLHDLFNFMCKDTNLKATESHDRIYAFLGFLDVEPFDIVVDYSMSYTKVFTQATCHLHWKYSDLTGTGNGKRNHVQQDKPLATTWVMIKRNWSLGGQERIVSENCYLGRTSEAAQVGDVICIFLGSFEPFLLRPGNDGGFRFASSIYFHGIMDGEFMKGKPAIEAIRLY
ncbi:hypothetical protein CC78DRAFT_614864 [Lojkania enalia]|uniref:Uncharacterized protein n=1 Tax=Lojkania enalia TaxID=147567 RepID=A0A9P4KFE9_9PLEO|nr:hypothetical protein CC78DRAFT_614864 [Didymosphaeria enalia]